MRARGTVTRRGEHWLIRVSTGINVPRKTDPSKSVRQRIVETFRGTEKKAHKRLTSILKSLDDHTLVESNKVTLKTYLESWLAVKRTDEGLSPNTITRYEGIVKQITTSTIGSITLQQLLPTHLELYFGALKRSASTRTIHAVVLGGTLDMARRDKKIVVNPLDLILNKPKRGSKQLDTAEACWTTEEVQKLVAKARETSPQLAALYALVLTAGLRLGELCGLRWSDVDWKVNKIRVMRQLLTTGSKPTYGPPKGKRGRIIELDVETIALLKAHKQSQSELKMQNRTRYHDSDLVFAKEWANIRKRVEFLGTPLAKNNWSQREHRQLCEAAGVRALKFHATRHSAATMLLSVGEALPVVSKRLGHSKTSMTTDIYGHSLPDAETRTATKAGELVHGKLA